MSSRLPSIPADIRGRMLPTLVTAALLFLAPGFAAPGSAQSSDEIRDGLDEIFGEWDSTRSPGCAAGITRSGAPLAVRAWGMADLEHGVPNEPGTIFEAGSVSKQFTAAAVALLALDGSLSFDDDVRDHVPELPDYGEPIRIHHLIHHTSGLRDWGSVAAIAGWGRSDRTHNHDHVVDIAARQSALNYPPGEAYSYTNTGYNLLAVIVERVSGQSFADFSRDRIFAPLGLHDTQWRDDYRRIVPGRSSAYSPSGEGFRINRPIEDVHGNGGLLTTVEDLLRWDDALRTASFPVGGEEEFRELMHRRGVLTDGREISYASGLFVDERRGVPYVSHTGATSGYRAFLGRYPDQELSVAVLCNVTNANPGALGDRVSDLVLGDLPDAGEPGSPAGIDLPHDVLERRAGLYRDERTGEPLRIRFEAGDLMLGNTPLVPLSDTEFQVGSGLTRFRFDGPAAGERVAFSATDDGWDGGRYLPVEPTDPAPSALREYVGSYHSDDAETTLVVEEEDGSLVIRRRPSSTMTLSPVYRDVFQAGGLGLVRFHRDAEGEIEEFGVRQGRVHDLRFRRIMNR